MVTRTGPRRPLRRSIITTIHGQIFLVSLSKDISPTWQAMNKFAPRGGVINPMDRFITTMIPKWTASTPSRVTMGSRMGVRMIMAAFVSIKVPTISSSTLIDRAREGYFYDCICV